MRQIHTGWVLRSELTWSKISEWVPIRRDEPHRAREGIHVCHNVPKAPHGVRQADSGLGLLRSSPCSLWDYRLQLRAPRIGQKCRRETAIGFISSFLVIFDGPVV